MMTDAAGLAGQVFASVWDALEDSPKAAMTMRLRSELMTAITQAVRGMSVAEAADRLELTQPRLGELLCGRISGFTLEALFELASRAGLNVRVAIEQQAA